MTEFSAFGPLLASAGLMRIMFVVFGCGSKVCRAIAAVLRIFFTLRYLWRHATRGIPKGDTLPRRAWAWTFFLFESTANLSSIIVYFFLSRTNDRSADADAAQNSPLLAAPVEVFIVT
ncbi:MAG: hypothetical protein WBG11_10290 [Methylocella sp.]